jgi:hypothetical protein
MPTFHLGRFTADVTPPLGHPLCGGWIEPVRAMDDPLRAIGIVLLGPAAPVVLCAVDWCGIRNDAHQVWCNALADAAHTTPERVAVQCVHPHNAPFADLEAQRLLEVAGGPPSLDLRFFDAAVARTAEAVRACLANTERATHMGTGQARVEQVASNRRILGPDGKVKAVRYSATKDPKVRAEPEGLIDPWLKVLSFWDSDRPLAALHYYATHPMSYYGDGRVTSDFCGLARDQWAANSKVIAAYFTGCAGNITAGKYNDGSKENRPILRDRVLAAMRSAWRSTVRRPLAGWQWRVHAMRFLPRRESSFGAEASRQLLDNASAVKAARGNAAYQLAFLARQDRPINLTCLDLGAARVLHLPGEPFIEYQLAAQHMDADPFVCVAGYGDDGTGYIPTDRAYQEGGYEPTVALTRPGERALLAAMEELLTVR